jgi:hypothetical protein
MRFESVIDPTQYWEESGATFDAILHACGNLPFWVKDAAKTNSKDVEADVIARYQFGATPIKGFTIDAQGVLCYPGDPKLYPFIKIALENGLVYYQYRNAWVAFKMGDNLTVYKLD